MEQVSLLTRMQQNEWVIARDDARVEPLAQALGISPLVAKALVNRGVVDVDAGRQFLQPKLIDLIRPARMPGIDAAGRSQRKRKSRSTGITMWTVSRAYRFSGSC
jgi:hypothetical protein